VTRIVVLLKDVPDLTEIKLDSQTRAPMTENVKRRVSEVDKRALEAAIKLKEAGGGEVVALSMGDEKTKTALLESLAMGADAAYIVIEPGFKWLDTNATSRVLASALKEIGDYDLIMSGEMTLDSLSSQIGPRLAELLGLPQITYVKEVELGEGYVKAVRELEDVDQVVEAPLPAVVSVIREINEPRIPSLMNIMKAKRKPTTIWNATDIGLDVNEVKSHSYVDILSVRAPEVQRKQIVIEADTLEEAAGKLADAIIEEGVLEA
jgi:electron transfer flavoprotein beta subunit